LKRQDVDRLLATKFCPDIQGKTSFDTSRTTPQDARWSSDAMCPVSRYPLAALSDDNLEDKSNETDYHFFRFTGCVVLGRASGKG